MVVITKMESKNISVLVENGLDSFPDAYGYQSEYSERVW
jgi:hypothetical protein